MPPNKERFMVLHYLLIILIIYIAYVLILFFMQRHMIFPGRALKSGDFQTHWVQDDQKHWIETNSGKVEAWFFRTRNRTRLPFTPVIIFAHGNFELIDFCQAETQEMNQLGADVLLMEFPGYGRSAGKPSEASITDAYVRAYDWLINTQNVNPQHIIGFGRSLGGGAICALAGKRPLRAMILQSTFSSVRSFARQYLVPSLLTRDPFDNVAVVHSFDNPTLIIHGKHDEIIPYKHAKILAESAPQATLISYDCAHNDCPPDWEAYWKLIAEFLGSLHQ